jgi:hypothetical protein
MTQSLTKSTFRKGGAKHYLDSAPLLLDLLNFLKVDNYNLKINFNNI